MFLFLIQFLLFRCKQFYRMLTGQGIYSLAFALLLLFIISYVFKQTLTFSQIGIQLVIALILLNIDQNRKDIQLIRHLKGKGRAIVLTEYLLLLFALELPYLFYQQLDHFVSIPLVTIPILLLIKYKNNTLLNNNKFHIAKNITKWLPIHAFEWRCGLRKNRIVFFLSYLLGLVLLFFFPVTPLFMLVWLSLATEFYKELENTAIIQAYQTVQQFKNLKKMHFFLTVNLIFLPQYLLYMILYHEYDQIVLLLFCIVIFNMICFFSALYKYKFSTVNNKVVNNTLPLIGFMFTLLIIPLSFYTILHLWKKVNHNLQTYLK